MAASVRRAFNKPVEKVPGKGYDTACRSVHHVEHTLLHGMAWPVEKVPGKGYDTACMEVRVRGVCNMCRVIAGLNPKLSRPLLDYSHDRSPCGGLGSWAEALLRLWRALRPA
eukprot:365280-Chlamydomonas_euryale.AAC.4